MFSKLKAFWSSLPHPVQAAITGGFVLAISTIGHALTSGGCVTVACLKAYLYTALAPAGAAIYAFYMKPSDGTTPIISNINQGKI